jgi:hypothetical protein
VDALTAALDALLGDAVTRVRIGCAGHLGVRDRFSVERVAEQYSTAMREAFPGCYDSVVGVHKSTTVMQ